MAWEAILNNFDALADGKDEDGNLVAYIDGVKWSFVLVHGGGTWNNSALGGECRAITIPTKFAAGAWAIGQTSPSQMSKKRGGGGALAR